MAMTKKITSDRNLTILFRQPPEKIIEFSFKFETGEFLFLQYLIKESFGRGRHHLNASEEDLSRGAKALWSNLQDGETITKRFTRSRVAMALRKFEELGFISTSRQTI